MIRYVSWGFVCSLLLISGFGVCLAEEAPSNIGYVQAGESTITNGSDGMMVLTAKDIVPYFHFALGDKSQLIPIERLSGLTYPLNGALVFSGADNESVSLAEISSLSFSDGNRTLTLRAKPLKFYDGDVLKSFAGVRSGLNTGETGEFLTTGIYLEIIGSAPENGLISLCEFEPWNCKQ